MMKRNLKKLLSLLLVLVCLVSIAPSSRAEGGMARLASAAAVMKFRSNDIGPITICKGILHSDGTAKETYMIVLCGANFNPFRQNNFPNFLLSAASIPTDYLATVKKAALQVIPAGANVILAGHSLGGTTAQQFAADKTMRERYNILNVLTGGSPALVLFQREGTLHRLADILDPVPMVSLAGPVNLFYQISYGLSDCFLHFKLSHTESYSDPDVWGSYDCLGVKNGGAYFDFDPATCRYFTAKLFQV